MLLERNLMAAPKTLKVGAVQMLTDHDLGANERNMVAALKEAEGKSCRVVLFHEGCLTGYPNRKSIGKLDFGRIEAAEGRLLRAAKRMRIAILMGSTSRNKGGIFNDLLIADERGSILGRYAKTWRAGEPHYSAGRGPVLFTVCGVKATAIICHDLRYPEMVRLPAAMGAKIVFIANNESGILHEEKLLGYRSMQISRATENLIYAVMANPPADPRNVRRGNASHGNSKIVDPLGNVLDEASHFEERLVVASLDLSKATGETALRTVGRWPKAREMYSVDLEHQPYAAWVKSGFGLVEVLPAKKPRRPRRR